MNLNELRQRYLEQLPMIAVMLLPEDDVRDFEAATLHAAQSAYLLIEACLETAENVGEV